jgi:hypothetical protein
VLLKRFRAAFIVNVNTSETTGWLEQYDENGGALHRKMPSSSNFSLGVNIFFEINVF